ncbi:hypothetical protein R3P38DRAFT_3326540 [Favolaschia claudopus]|uniref:Uncharacterized protein n=1 Tax=Favolaschia claudopus TaxID=2862362 RepID=A0AAW0A8W2_9AGAR
MDTNTCTDIDKCRTLYDIMWTCLTTIFVCIWVSVHPNMPPQPEKISPSWCRLMMMLVALIAPEIMVAFAARQWFSAKRFSKEHKISLTHGFFYSMGGFVDTEGYPIIDEEQVTPLVLAAMKAVSEADIEDKSKRDALAKLLAVTQILRVVAQSLARWNQHLAITSLEIATVAYAVVTTFMWFFWMSKPLDTETTIQIAVENPHSTQGGTVAWFHTKDSWNAMDRFLGMLLGYSQSFDTRNLKNVPAFFSPPQDWQRVARTAFRFECAVAIAFGAIHCVAWNTKFPSMAEKWMWCLSAVVVTVVPVALLVVWDPYIPLPDWLATAIWYLAVFAGVPLYVVARLFLLGLPFTTLRSLEPAVLVNVRWEIYIPHL